MLKYHFANYVLSDMLLTGSGEAFNVRNQTYKPNMAKTSS
jgi:hypothetical protein